MFGLKRKTPDPKEFNLEKLAKMGSGQSSIKPFLMFGSGIDASENFLNHHIDEIAKKIRECPERPLNILEVGAGESMRFGGWRGPRYSRLLKMYFKNKINMIVSDIKPDEIKNGFYILSAGIDSTENSSEELVPIMKVTRKDENPQDEFGLDIKKDTPPEVMDAITKEVTG